MSNKNAKNARYRGPSRPVDPRRAPGRKQPQRADRFGYTLVAIGVALVVVLVVLASIFQGGSGTPATTTTTGQQAPAANDPQSQAAATSAAATAVEQVFSTQVASLPTISPADAKALYSANNAKFIDVRDQAKYAASHITGAPNVLYSDAQNHLAEFPKNGNLILYCQ